MAERRYAPCGIAFQKDTVFKAGGGPALYVRGDEWPDVDHLPPRIRARAARYWPGAEAGVGEDELPWYLERPSEWVHEREWRLLGMGEPPAFEFQWEQVSFVIAPDLRWQSFVGSFIGSFSEPTYEQAFMRIPTVVVAADGTAIVDPNRIWITG